MSALALPVSTIPQNLDVMARTIWGEARGEGQIGMIAVAHVILNRVRARRWYGRGVKGVDDHSVAAVCLKPWQFSCWNAADPNREKLLALTPDDPDFRRCLFAALGVMINAQGFADPTEGSDHYHADHLTPGQLPDWAKGERPVVSIGRHKFYNTIR